MTIIVNRSTGDLLSCRASKSTKKFFTTFSEIPGYNYEAFLIAYQIKIVSLGQIVIYGNATTRM